MLFILFIIFMMAFSVWLFFKQFGPIGGIIFTVAFYAIMIWMSLDPYQKRLDPAWLLTPEGEAYLQEHEERKANDELGWW
jgi:predicted ABC-type exoprotein transport system permease subunit